MLLKTCYKPFLFKLIECMDTIRVVRFLHYKSMIGLSCFKPSFFWVNELSLYPYNIVGILIKLIFCRGGIFLNNHNNVVFTRMLNWKAHLFLFLFGQKFFHIRSQDIKKPMFTPTTFLFLFFHLLTYTNPNILTDAKQQVLTLFYWCFLSLTFFITIIPLKKVIFIIIIPMITTIIIIIIIPHPHPLSCNKPIRNKL